MKARLLFAISLALTASVPRLADAQSADWIEITDQPSALAGRCGSYSETNLGLVVAHERDDPAFRGLGSPGQGTSVAATLRTPIAPYDTLQAVALDFRLRSVVANHVAIDRSCLIVDVAAGVPVEIPDHTSSSIALGLTLLERAPHDRWRLEFGADFALPSVNELTESRDVQRMLAGGLANIEEMYRWLPNLEWSVRGRARFESRSDFGEGSLWLALAGQVGYARMATPAGAIEGLLGGLGLELLVGGGRIEAGRHGIRAGARAGLSISSLWPTDVLFPWTAEIVIQWQVKTSSTTSFDVDLHAGPIGVSYLLSTEFWALAGVRLTVHFEEAPARPIVYERISRTRGAER